MTTSYKRKRPLEPAWTIVEGKDYEDQLTCCICTDLVFKRVFLKCGHSFCKKCIDQSKTCPKCRGCKEGVRDKLSELEKAVLEKILVECNQCEKQMNCSLTEEHKARCWRYRCKNPGCSDLVSDQKRHDTMCSYRQMKCDWASSKCKWKGLAKDIEAHKKLHREFIAKRDKLLDELSLLKQEYAVTLFHGHRKEQFVARQHMNDWEEIEHLEYVGDSVTFSIWNEDLWEFQDFVIPKSDPRLVYCVKEEHLEYKGIQDMELVAYWAPDREEPEDDPGSQLFSS